VIREQKKDRNLCEGKKNKIVRSNGTVFQSRDFEQKIRIPQKYRKLKGPNVQWFNI
jgi:hypothetical protein